MDYEDDLIDAKIDWEALVDLINQKTEQFTNWVCGTKYQCSTTKDGFSVFSALAGFAIAQGVTLTAVAKGEGHDLLVICIYIIAVILTAIWTIFLLWSKRTEEVGSLLTPKTVWAFDRPSMVYGVFALGWIVLVGAVMVLLGAMQLLPNQTRRVAYMLNDIVADSYLIQNRNQGGLAASGGSASERQAMDIWIEWIARGQNEFEKEREIHKQSVDRRLVWVEQRTQFQDHYKTFAGQVSYDKSHFKITDRSAFLVHRETSTGRTIYRQLLFRLNDDGSYSDTFTLYEPEPGESLVVMVFIEGVDGAVVPVDTGLYGIQIIKAK